jgi:acyl carrier protein
MVEIVESVREDIRSYILSNFLFTDDASQLNDTDSFRDGKVIDSMGMVELIHFLEEEFKIKVLDEDMVPEKLDSVDRLVTFVRSKRGMSKE